MSNLKPWSELTAKYWQDLEIYNAHLAPHIRYWSVGELLTEEYIPTANGAPPVRKYFIQSVQYVVSGSQYTDAMLKTTFSAFRCYVKDNRPSRKTILRDFNSLESLYAALLDYDKKN